MDDEDRKLFADSLAHATETCTAGALDAALDELGWSDALSDEPRLAVSILFELQGAANATSSAIEDVLAASLGIERKPTTGVVLPGLPGHAPPGELTGDGLAVRGVGLRGLLDADTAVVVARAGAETLTVVVDRADLTLRPVTGLDPRLGLVEVATSRVVSSSHTQPSPAPWSAALTAGQVAVAHELIGASRAMLRLARDHAVDRVQFGRPIASFQAVRHRLADSLVAIEAADAATSAAWDTATPLAGSLAKAIAGRSARTVARHAQQVLAGMGFTSEHPLHRYVRRALVLDQVLGASYVLTRELGEQILRTRRLPAPIPL